MPWARRLTRDDAPKALWESVIKDPAVCISEARYVAKNGLSFLLLLEDREGQPLGHLWLWFKLNEELRAPKVRFAKVEGSGEAGREIWKKETFPLENPMEVRSVDQSEKSINFKFGQVGVRILWDEGLPEDGVEFARELLEIDDLAQIAEEARAVVVETMMSNLERNLE